MNLIYIYHSGFAITGDGFTIIIDYYKDTEKEYNGLVHDVLLSRPGRLYVMATHSHADHFNPEIMLWKERRPDICYILSKDILDAGMVGKQEAVFLEKLDTYKDEVVEVKAFGSTDIGISFLIHVGGKKIFHAGDLNNWHWNEEATPEESATYEQAFLRELDILAQEVSHLDLVAFPIDPRLGRDYMRGAEQFIKRIPVDCIVPMHFGENYQKAAAFKATAEEHGCKFVSWTRPGERLEL